MPRADAVLFDPSVLQLLYVSRNAATTVLCNSRSPGAAQQQELDGALAGCFVVLPGQGSGGCAKARQVMRSTLAPAGPSTSEWLLQLEDGCCVPLNYLCHTPDLRTLGRATLRSLCAELCWRTEAGLRHPLTVGQVRGGLGMLTALMSALRVQLSPAHGQHGSGIYPTAQDL